MCDGQHRHPEQPLRIQQLLAHADTQQRIERRKRFVKQQNCRLPDERARQSDALPLASRNLPRIALRHTADLEDVHQVPDPLGDFSCRPPAPPRIHRKRHVIFYSEVRKQGIVLEQVPDRAHACRNVDSACRVEQHPAVHDNAPAVRPVQPGDCPQCRGLARS